MRAPHTVGGHRPSSLEQPKPSFGSLLRTLRLRARLTQELLAERAGVSVATIAALEEGLRRRPYPNTVAALAEALGLSAEERAALQAVVPLRGQPEAPPTSTPTARRQTPPPEPPPDVVRSMPPVSIPRPPTPLIGRETDVAAAAARLDPVASGVRLLTFVGPGGVGKSRLAMAVAARLVAAYADGVVFVDLAPLHDHRLVPATIAHALQVRESGSRSARELVLDYLRNRQMLLVLENVEHLLAAVPVISELLEGCQHLRLLVTSRSVLRLRVEQRFPVAPLPTPPDELLPVDAIAASPSVRLFVERAQSVNADFTLDDGNARAVAAICRRLDGVPLAIELAAARVSLLRPEALLRRLERRLPLLTGGAADLPERQQTLVKTLAWSHGLLGQRDQAVFRRLAVFEGGCTLEAVEKVCAFREHVNDAFVGPSTSNDELTADEMLESVQSLIDNSLLRPTPTQNGLRLFVMLETIREYAYECLTHSGEAERARSRHLAWYLSLAEHAAAELTGPQQAQWLEHLDLMLDNMRAALSWAYASRQIEVGLRLAGALGRFWATRRYVGEGREWLERFLEAGSGLEIAAAVRAPATYAAGLLASIQGDYAWAVQRLEQSTSFYRAAGDLLGAVRAQNTRAGVTYDQGNRADALAQWEQTLQDARLTGNLGDVAHLIGNQGEALFHMGDLAAAEARHEDALALARRAGRTDVEAMQLGNLGNVARERGDLAVASDFHRQALTIKQQLGARRQIAITLADMASVAGAAGQGIRAARLLAAAMALRETIGLPQPVPERTGMLRAVTPALAELNEEARETAFAEGRAFTLEQAIAYAME